jgi:hypothetical protein
VRSKYVGEAHGPLAVDHGLLALQLHGATEDGLEPEDLIPDIGPYDKYIIHWGYAPITGAKSSDAEWATLDSGRRNRTRRRGSASTCRTRAGADQSSHSEAVGDADPVKATAGA